MDSTMQRTPLLISSLMRYGALVHADQKVITWTGDGSRSITYRQVGEQAAQLAHALRSLGVTGDQRVGTFMWNNAEHLITYLAVPSMGAVLHALNIRLFPPQIIYVANHADDRVVIDSIVGDVSGGAFPATDAELGEAFNTMTAATSPTTTSMPTGCARARNTATVWGWVSWCTRKRSPPTFDVRRAIAMASAAAVASSSSDALANGKPVSSPIIVWKLSNVSSLPWLISGWYGV